MAHDTSRFRPDPFSVAEGAPGAVPEANPENSGKFKPDPFSTAAPPPAPEQYESQDSQWSLANVGRQALGQGLALGAGDEVVGTLRGLWNATGSDQSYSDAINQGIDAERAANEAFEEENPWASGALQIGGGLLTGGIGAGRAAALKGASLLNKSLRGAGVGAGSGAVAGGMSAEGNVLDGEGLTKRALGTAMGAALGGTLGGALPVAVKGGIAAANAVGRWSKNGAEKQAQRVVRNAMAEDGMTEALAGKDMAQMGPLAVAADVGDKNIQDVARLYSNTQGGKNAHKMLEARHIDQGPRIEQSIDTEIASISLPDYLISGQAARQASARKNYGDVYKAEIELDDKLKGFFQNDAIKDAYAGAEKIAAVTDDVLTPLSTKTDAGTVYAKPNMETLDFIKQALDDNISKAVRDGDNQYAAALTKKRGEFIKHLDEISPKNEKGESLYAKARSEYAGASQAMEAAELGQKFIATPKSVSVKQVEDMGAHEREAFLVGVAEELRYKALSTPDQADVVKKIFGNHLARRRLKIALDGDEAKLKSFEQTLENERRMAITNDSVRTGSRTAPMQKDAETMAGALGDGIGVAAGSPVAALSLMAKARDAVSTPPEAVAKRVTEMLLTPGADPRKVMKELLQQGPTFGKKQSTRGRRAASTAAGQFMGSGPGQYFNE